MKKTIVVLLVTVLLLTSAPLIIVYAKSDNSNKPTNTKEQKVNGKSTNKTTTSSDPKQYGFEVVGLSVPGTMKTGEVANLDLVIKNTSNFDWDSNGSNAVSLAYHWIDQNGQYEVFRSDITTLKKAIKSGATSNSQRLQVRSPEIPGNFTFSLDLIQKDIWFTEKTDDTFKASVNVTGEVRIYEDEGVITVNGDAEYTNNPNFTLGIGDLAFQPSSENAGFLYEYVQGGLQMNASLSTIGSWGKWGSINDQEATFNSGISEPYSGLIKVFGRFRAFKKHSTATPESYGSAIYHYGRSSKTSGAYWDEIFFDNISPQGSITINNGASYTTSTTVNLQISATDDLLGMTGSGLNGMRLDYGCDGRWGEWEDIGNKSSVNLGSGSVLKACVQFRDKAGNVSDVYRDTIAYYVPGNIGGISTSKNPFVAGNETYVDSNGNRIVSRLAGTPENPFGNKTASGLSTPTIIIKSTLNGFGQRGTYVVETHLPPPEITYMDINDKQTSVTIYGVAMQKWDDAVFEITHDQWIPNCFSLIYTQCIETKTVNVNSTLEHVGMSLYEQTPWWWIGGHYELAWTWVDNANGQWQITLPLSAVDQYKLNLGDYIYGRSKAYGWVYTGIEGIGNFDYGASNKLISGYSNVEEIRDVVSRSITDNFGVLMENGDRKWTEDQLFFAYNAFAEVPLWMYGDYLNKVIRKSEFSSMASPDAWTNPSKSGREIELYDDAGSGAFMKEILQHELMHVYQFKFGGQRPDAHTNPDVGSDVYNYYIVAGFEKTADGFRYTRSTNSEYWDDFVSFYAKDEVERRDAEFEDMAESLLMYLIDKSAFTTFDEERDKVGNYTLADIKDGDPKTSEIIKAKFEFIKNNIF